MPKLFVYGTLRKGATANYLMQGCKLLKEAIPLNGFSMYSYGPYPFCLCTNQNSDTIIGDLYETESNTLQILDEYEGEEYTKHWIEAMNCYIYIKKDPNPGPYPKMLSGDWLNQ